MANIVSVIEEGLGTLRGKTIIISFNDSNVEGVLQSFKSKEYFYELVLKSGRYKKKFILFYPFSAKVEKGSLLFDYRVKKLPSCISSELVYNMFEGDSHPFFNTIVRVCELT